MSSYKINIITLFPDFFDSPLKSSLLGKAIQKEILIVDRIHLRNYAVNQYGKVDDTPYGGGPGMVLMAEPIDKAILAVRKQETSYMIFLTPRGKKFSQRTAGEFFNRLNSGVSLSLICGHYEGVDERVVELGVDESVSIGDFVLSGGESAALVVLESVARLIPEFMGNQESLKNESFSQEDYVEYPHYTRPFTYKGLDVPEVLRSGDHEKIRQWRQENSV